MLLLVISVVGCNVDKKSELDSGKISTTTAAFRNYWYAGKAEVNSYTLSQSRYGQNRKGNAVLIFVTEDFSKKKQVKLDGPDNANLDKVSVLKMNFTKNFITGIYPYSMMLSVFTPITESQQPSSLKIVMSAQEWCGQVYTQMNLKGNRYSIKSHSYFEKEADKMFSVKKVLLEDELMNIIRLDHKSLPVGEIKILPGLFFTRLNHIDLKSEKAFADKTESDSTYRYTIAFSSAERKLIIDFEKNFPNKIVSWKESWKEHDQQMETTAQLDKTLYTDYWTKNSKEFHYLRDSLNLKFQPEGY